MNSYQLARTIYQELGVDTESALEVLTRTPISIQCWQGDDVGGFENTQNSLEDSGIKATGNYPGKARSIPELRQDLQMAFSLIPGSKRLNLHAFYADLKGRTTTRDEYEFCHFQSWIEWCQEQKVGFDFNPTFFAHPKASTGLTLSHPDREIRKFWIRHGVACRQIAAEAGMRLGSPTITNFWIPDGSKDLPLDRKSPRLRLEESLDEIFSTPVDQQWNLDAVESKLFGIGSESYVVGSHEFYLGYAVKNQLIYCLDAGHFHPTENLADKISSLLQFVPQLLLHISRGVRWDSDHVPLFDDTNRAIMEEIVRGQFLARTHIGLDFFDASINRICAWVIGARAAQKSLLHALLEPTNKIREAEDAGDFSSRLALMEETKLLPLGAVWNEFCERQNVPPDHRWLSEIKNYEKQVLSKRA